MAAPKKAIKDLGPKKPVKGGGGSLHYHNDNITLLGARD